MAYPVSKRELLREAMRAGDWRRAISIASRFPVCPCALEVRRAQSAALSPSIYAQLGHDPVKLHEQAKAALLRHYPI